MILLDTNILVWLFNGDPRLGKESRIAIEEARNRDVLYVSAITPWQISMLVEKGRLNLGIDTLRWMMKVLSFDGINFAAITPSLAVDAGRLPGDIHGDPGDRLIIATARDLNCTLLTSDRKVLDYGAAGHVAVRDARL